MNHEFSPSNIKENEFYKRFRGFVEVKYGVYPDQNSRESLPEHSQKLPLVPNQSGFKAPTLEEIALAYPQ